MCGRLDLLLDDLLEMHQYAVDLKNVYMQSWSGFVIAHHNYLVGELPNALEFAEKTLLLVRKNKFFGQPLETTLALNGGIHEKLGNVELAEEYYRESQWMIKAGEMRDFLHIPLAGRARLASRKERFDEALAMVFEFLPLLQSLRIYENGMVINSYLTAYNVLLSCGNACAISILEEAVEKVNATGQMIKDNDWKRMFYECNQYNREVINEWKKILSKC
jgi:tetratricopeptide (TPR) repeat protein